MFSDAGTDIKGQGGSTAFSPPCCCIAMVMIVHQTDRRIAEICQIFCGHEALAFRHRHFAEMDHLRRHQRRNPVYHPIPGATLATDNGSARIQTNKIGGAAGSTDKIFQYDQSSTHHLNFRQISSPAATSPVAESMLFPSIHTGLSIGVCKAPSGPAEIIQTGKLLFSIFFIPIRYVLPHGSAMSLAI